MESVSGNIDQPSKCLTSTYRRVELCILNITQTNYTPVKLPRGVAHIEPSRASKRLKRLQVQRYHVATLEQITVVCSSKQAQNT
jgi:hypothetical protein